jgi:hypothetical protein
MTEILLPVKIGILSFQQHVQTGSGAHSASYPMGTGVFSTGVKRPEHGMKLTTHLHTSQHVLIMWCLIRHNMSSRAT